MGAAAAPNEGTVDCEAPKVGGALLAPPKVGAALDPNADGLELPKAGTLPLDAPNPPNAGLAASCVAGLAEPKLNGLAVLELLLSLPNWKVTVEAGLLASPNNPAEEFP